MSAPASPVRPAMPPVIPGVCDTGRTACGQPGRLYAAGWRCVQHSPAALAGRPEPPVPPTRDPQRWDAEHLTHLQQLNTEPTRKDNQ